MLNLDIDSFKDGQTFMNDVLEDHLKTDKGKPLTSQFKTTHDAKISYPDLKEPE
jgi:hypothetical protein